MHQILNFETQVFEYARVLGHQVQLRIIGKLVIFVHLELVAELLGLADLADSTLPPQYVVLLFEDVDLGLSLAVLSDLIVHLLADLLSILIQMLQSGMHVQNINLQLLVFTDDLGVVVQEALDLRLLGLDLL